MTIDNGQTRYKEMLQQAKANNQQWLVTQLERAAASGKHTIRLIDSYYEHIKLSPTVQFPVFTNLSYYEGVRRGSVRRKHLAALRKKAIQEQMLQES